jgi:ribosome-associated toxin RatA of RatAB toxin-antitoxin module
MRLDEFTDPSGPFLYLETPWKFKPTHRGENAAQVSP